MLDVLDGAAVRRWCRAGLAALTAARAEIDALNVYPVPDGDTGTNLVLTMQSVAEALDQLAPDGDADLALTARAMAHSALLGARGNSGVILSQLLGGLAEVLAPPVEATVDGAAGAPGGAPAASAGGPELQRALGRAADLCYAAVATPVEGTVLTVARAAAHAAQSVVSSDLVSVATAAAGGAAAALARTPEQLPVLAAAGVVDAGGRGLVVLLEALRDVVTGAEATSRPALVVPRDGSGTPVLREVGSGDYAYEVQYLLDAAPPSVDELKCRLAALGDSLVVVGGASPAATGTARWKIHVHVNDVGAAVEAGVEAGRPHAITVTRFADQVVARAPWTSPPGPVVDTARAVVAVAAGAGLHAIFRDAGAYVVTGGSSTGPSTREILEAIRATGAREVAVLPNDPNLRAAAGTAAALARGDGVTASVVPTESPVQGLAAVAVFDRDRPFADVVASMTATAGSTRWGAVTRAVRTAHTPAGSCRPGDTLGLLDGQIGVIGSDEVTVAAQLLDRLLGTGGDLVTVVVGADAPAGLGDRVAACIGDRVAACIGDRVAACIGEHRATEVVVFEGGQPHYALLLGVE